MKRVRFFSTSISGSDAATEAAVEAFNKKVDDWVNSNLERESFKLDQIDWQTRPNGGRSYGYNLTACAHYVDESLDSDIRTGIPRI